MRAKTKNNKYKVLEQIFNASKDLQVLINHECKIELINTSYLNYLKVSRDQAIRKKCHELLKGKLCGTPKCPLKQVIEKNEVVEIEVTKNGYADMPRPFLLTATPLRTPENEVVGMIASFKDIATLKRTEHRLYKLYKGTICSIAEIVETRDPYTAGHQQRVATIADRISRAMGLSSKQLEIVNTAAILHDVGKIYVPSSFLTKPGKLSDIEFEIIKTHAVKGYDILKSIPFEHPIAQIVQQHHERIDGSGYPFGLTRDALLLEAKIIAVADVVEAISSHRPYRASLGINSAIDEIKRNKNIKYDSDVVDACLKIGSASFR